MEKEPGTGIVLQMCNHLFCKDCISEYAKHAIKAELECPSNKSCKNSISHYELKRVMEPVDFDKFLKRCFQLTVNAVDNSVRCKTVDCDGYTIIDDENDIYFICELCQMRNCLQCDVSMDVRRPF